MQFSISVKGIDKVTRDLDKYSENVRKGITREVARTTTDIHRHAQQAAPMGAEGTLKRKINFAIADMVGEVWSGAEYSIGVEKGQKPGKWPQYDDLMRWVQRKLRVPKNKLKSVTFLVGRKIFEQGTKAQPFFEPQVRKHEKRFQNRILKVVNQRA
jgi:hypothetical protein